MIDAPRLVLASGAGATAETGVVVLLTIGDSETGCETVACAYTPTITKGVALVFFLFFFVDFVDEGDLLVSLFAAGSLVWTTANATCDRPSTTARPAKTTETRNALDMPVSSPFIWPTIFGEGEKP